MKKKIVVVENEKDVSEIIQYVLSEIGSYDVVLVNNIVDFNRIAEQKPQVVLIDDWLIDGPGLKLCSELKSNPLTQQIPVIFMSTSEHIVYLATSCGADDFLQKPFDINLLIDKVTQITNERV